jgi:hypothetical protein
MMREGSFGCNRNEVPDHHIWNGNILSRFCSRPKGDVCKERKSKITIESSWSTVGALLVLTALRLLLGKSPSAAPSSETLRLLESSVPRIVYRDPPVQYIDVRSNNYGCLGFIGDVLMTVVTGGLWLIWIFVREMRRR